MINCTKEWRNMGILGRIKNTLKLARNRVRRKKYVLLQKPVNQMCYEEVKKEFYRKEKNIFSQDGNFEGRNYELISQFLTKNQNENFKINYFVKLINNNDISKNVKIKFINNFINLYEINELLELLDINLKTFEQVYKFEIVKNNVEKLSENILIKYFDFTDINLKYLKNLLDNLSVDGKIAILNKISITNKMSQRQIAKKLSEEQIGKLDFDEGRKLCENLIVYDFGDIENYYINQIKKCDVSKVYKIMNNIEYISPKLAYEFDQVIEVKEVNEVIDYINNNRVNKGGIIYLNRKFDLENKQKVFYSLNDIENRKNAVAMFKEEIDKNDFMKMVEKEKSVEVKQELADNMLSLLKLT